VRAVVHDRYGPPEVLRVEDVQRPIPKEDEVLVRIRATSVTRSDGHLRAGTPFVQRLQSGLRRPKRRILGHELAGEVVEVGSAVTEFQVGDRVFGALPYLALRTGSHAEYMAIPRCKTKNVELVRSLGADEVIDYEHEDFTKNGKSYDVIFDAVGKHSFGRCKGSLRSGGVYLPTDGFRNIFLWLVHKRFGDKKVVFELPPRYRKEDAELIAKLLESGRYTPVIDRVYPLEDVVEATRYVETQQKTGNVVLTLDGAAS
jgi:NADPH:quinone reductase-like Zn-dependent oxidoreductase